MRKYVNAQEIFHPVVLFFIKCRIIKKLLFAVKLDIDFTFTASTKIGKFGNENKKKMHIHINDLRPRTPRKP